MTLNKVKEFYTEWFNVSSNITSKFRTITIFKSFVKEPNKSNRLKYVDTTFIIVYCTKLHLSNKSATLHELSP
jgi:hypothetical protein